MADKIGKLARYTVWAGSKAKCHGCGRKFRVGEEYEVLHEDSDPIVRHLECMDRLLYSRNVEREHPDSEMETRHLEGTLEYWEEHDDVDSSQR